MMGNRAAGWYLFRWRPPRRGWDRAGPAPPHQGDHPMHHPSRRDLLLAAGDGAAALAVAPLSPLSLLADDKKPEGFTLPKLPYAFDALEPHIDAKTMEIHHDKHHAAYVANLNKALDGHPDLQSKGITELLRDIKS